MDAPSFTAAPSYTKQVSKPCLVSNGKLSTQLRALRIFFVRLIASSLYVFHPLRIASYAWIRASTNSPLLRPAIKYLEPDSATTNHLPVRWNASVVARGAPLRRPLIHLGVAARTVEDGRYSRPDYPHGKVGRVSTLCTRCLDTEAHLPIPILVSLERCVRLTIYIAA